MDFLKTKYNNIADKTSPYFILPPFGIGTLILCYDIYLISNVGKSQYKKPTAYSKFSKQRERIEKKMTMSGSTLQTIAYGMPFIAITSYLYYQFKSQTSTKYKDLLQFIGINIVHNELEIDSTQFRYKLPFVLILTHFIKRMFEANFIHIISNKVYFLYFVGNLNK